MNRSARNLFKTITLALFMLSLNAEPSKTVLPLAGIAVQEKLRVPIVYAAVFSQHYTAQDFKTNPNYPVRLEARYIQEKFSKRQNHQLWIERILINTPRSELEELSLELLEFSSLMKQEMKKGDHLVFEYFPGFGTRVILNDVLVTTFKNFEFQKALTAIWFGKRPPTITFQEQLLSKPKSKLISEFNALEYSASRKREIAALYEPEDSPSNKASSKQVSKVAKAEEKAQNSNIKKPTVQKKAKKKPSPAKKKQTPVSKPVVSKNTSTKSKSKDVTKQPENSKPIAKDQSSVKTSKSKPIEREKPILVAQESAQQPAKSQRAGTTFDQIILEMKDDYIEDVQSYIESQARPIPPRKVRRKPKADARILVTFEEGAGAIEITDSKIIEGTFQPEVEQVLHQSIKELKKIPLMPEPIKGEVLTLEVTLSFAKCKRTPSAWLCF
jgi:outer membrane biosynthesis protein TonB